VKQINTDKTAVVFLAILREVFHLNIFLTT